jgi:hypothetical protein
MIRGCPAPRGPMLKFHCSIHGSAPAAPLAVSFDAALAELGLLPRLFIEPDGSFVWRGATAQGAEWQVDGNLVDRGHVLDYVELNGACPSERLDEILRMLGWPAASLTFQLSRLGVFLTEEEFRRQAATPAGAG